MDAESKARARDYLAADIFLTTARLAGTAGIDRLPKETLRRARGGFLPAQWRTNWRRERALGWPASQAVPSALGRVSKLGSAAQDVF
jgi:hypothetical protein